MTIKELVSIIINTNPTQNEIHRAFLFIEGASIDELESALAQGGSSVNPIFRVRIDCVLARLKRQLKEKELGEDQDDDDGATIRP